MRIQKKIGDMMKIKVLTALIFVSTVALAQNISIQSEIDKTELGEYETLVYSITVQGTAQGNINPPSELQEHFNIESGPNRYQSRMATPGRLISIQKLVYELRPKHTGRIEIGSATLELGEDLYESNSHSIEVRPHGNTQYDDDDPRAIAARMADVRIIPTKLRVYEGESFGISYKIFSKFRLSSLNVLREHESYSGFIVEQLEEDVQARQTKDANGEPRLEYNVKTLSMTATQEGVYEFDPYVVSIPTPLQLNRFSARVQVVDNIEKAYHPDIEVLPLPVEGRPENFSGGVGELTFDMVLSRNEVPVNESATIELIVRGLGNIRSIQLPDLNLPDQLEVYAPKDDIEVRATPYGPKGEVSRKFTLVPRYPGSYTIPPIEFVYFDPETEQYVVVQTEEQEIISEGDAPVSTTPRTSHSSRSMASVDQRDVEILNEDIRWIHVDDYRGGSGLPFYTRGWFLGGMGGATLVSAWMLLSGTFRRWSKDRYNALKAESKIALQRLKRTENWAELNQLLEAYLEKGFGVPKAEQIYGKLQAKLHEEGVTPEDAQAMYELINACEASEYGNAQFDLEQVKHDINHWIQKQL